MNIWLKSAALGLAAAVIGFFLLRLRDNRVLPPVYNASFTLQTDGASDAGTTRSVATSLEKRLEGLDFTIKITGPGVVNVRIRKVPDTTYLRQLVSSPGRVSFRPAYNMIELGNDFLGSLFKAVEQKRLEQAVNQPLSPSDSLRQQIESFENANPERGKEKDSKHVLLSPLYNTPESPEIGYNFKEDTAALARLLKADSLLRHLPNGVLPEFYFGLPAYPDPKSPGKLVLYALSPLNPLDENVLTNDDLESARAEFGYKDQPVVMIQLTKTGQRKWTRLTRQNVLKPMAIVMDKLIISAPVIESEMNAASIQLAGSFSFSQCQIMARLISSRPMAAPVRVVSATTERTSYPFAPRQLLGPGLLFLLAGGLAFFVFKTLKST